MADLQKQFGNIDIYLFDQILKGRILPRMRILDAGCGGGRNLVYFLQQHFEVFGVDQDPQCIAEVRQLASHLGNGLPPANFQVGRVEAIPHPDAFFDWVLSNAVLHFAEDERHLVAMVKGMWRVLKSGGVLFVRLASSIGMEKGVKRVKGRRFLLPDGTERFLVDAAMLEKLTRGLGAELVDPIKTTIVQNQRCMTTWVIRKF